MQESVQDQSTIDLLELTKKELEAEREEFKLSSSRWSTKVSALEKEIAEISQQFDLTQKHLKDAERALGEMKMKVAVMSDEKERMQMAMTGAQSESEKLNREIITLKELNSNLKSEKMKADGRLEEMQIKLKERENALELFESRIVELKDKQNKDLQSNENGRTQILESDLKEAREAIAMLSQQMEAISQAKNMCAYELEQVFERLRITEMEKSESMHQILDLRLQLSNAKESEREQELALKDLEQAVLIVKGENDSLVGVQDECKRLKAELEKTKNALKKEEELAQYRQGQLLDLQGKVKGLEVFARQGSFDLQKGQSDEEDLPMMSKHLDRSNFRNKTETLRKSNFASWSQATRRTQEESVDEAAMKQKLLGRRGAVAILRMIAKTSSRYLLMSCFNAWKEIARDEIKTDQLPTNGHDNYSSEEDSRQLAIERIEKELHSLKYENHASDRRRYKRPQSVDPASVKASEQLGLSRPKSQAKILTSLGHSSNSVDSRRRGKEAAESPKSALKSQFHSLTNLGSRTMSNSELNRSSSSGRSKPGLSEDVEEQIIRLIRLGRSNSQVLSHYAVSPYGVSEEQVESMRESFIRNPTVGFSALRRDGGTSNGRRSESEDSEHEESLEIRYGVSSRLSLASHDE
eukprot:756749-Hanusia_phi.AAC.8